jgi:chorismate synthase
MNTIGRIFRCTTFGESHGKAIGCVLDGVPAGLNLTYADIERELEKDVPNSLLGTPRKEENNIEILSGILDDITLGTPICIVIYNKEHHSNDYLPLKETYRPGHGEFTYHKRFNTYTPYGGGRASGRECIARLAGGAVAKKLLERFNITFDSKIESLGGFRCDSSADEELAINNCAEIYQTKKDSTGGIINMSIKNVPAGVGSPIFGKLHALLSYSLMTIGGVKGIENGLGFECASLTGSEFNDPFGIVDDEIKPLSNNAGGVLAGISNGQDLTFRIAVKPTPSISIPQKTVNWKKAEEVSFNFNGRFDMNFTPRVIPIAEAMAAMVLVDEMILSGFINPTKFESGCNL